LEYESIRYSDVTSMSLTGTRHSLPVAFHFGGVARALALPLRRWRNLTAAIFVHYHPERHYMRGPGPKWHEKHGALGLRTKV
jgi:hypothetical protein